ncbi:MAG: DUF262 domain-containing protein [Desulfobacterales bacterium]
MEIFSESEKVMWDKPIKEPSESLSDAELNEKYKAGDHRIVTETNREKIPNFVKALEKPDYMQIRPFYQRRDRWDRERQSQLIESFIMNIPVPPLFLYEKDFNKYEVMDGQQRITALQSFYSGEFKLSGLDIWKELNGRTYSTLPSQVRSGIDRRSISYIVVLRESTPDEEDAIFLRQTVFERLNTGGIRLEHQEIRNCLYQSQFNKLLVKLTETDDFRDSFGLPRYTVEEEEPNAEIKKAAIYQKMSDVEIVLRFFALRHIAHYTKGMHGFLDLYMARARNFSFQDLEILKNLFLDTIRLARNIYADLIFRPYSPEKGEWQSRAHKAFYDAVMVSLSSVLSQSDILIGKKDEIIQETQKLFENNPSGTFTGRGNTKADIQERIQKYSDMIHNLL